MASPQTIDFEFPYFPPPPYHPFYPPPPAAKPPSPSRSPPPPTPSHPFAPPPPPHVHPPPSPHVRPPPSPHVRPPPPSPSPDNHPTVIVIVFISLGCLFFLAFLAAALFCCIKKKKKKMVQETEVIHFDEHRKVQEAIIPGPHGTKSVILSIEEDVHLDEEVKKKEKFGEELHAKSGEPKSGTLEEGASSNSGSHHHHLEYKA